MADKSPTKTWRDRIGRWIAAARTNRDAATLRNQIDWFDRIQPDLTAVAAEDRAAMAAQLRTALSELGA